MDGPSSAMTSGSRSVSTTTRRWRRRAEPSKRPGSKFRSEATERPSGLLAHQPQLALRLDVGGIELEHALVALLRELHLAQHLPHVAEEEVRRQTLVDHLDRLLAVPGRLLVNRLSVARDEKPRVPAPGIELRLLVVHLDGLLEEIEAFLVLVRLDEDLRPLEILFGREDARHVDAVLLALQLVLVVLAPLVVAQHLRRLVDAREEPFLELPQRVLRRIGHRVGPQLLPDHHHVALVLGGPARLP